MVPKEDLKEVVILEFLTDAMLEKIRPLFELIQINEQRLIFEEGGNEEIFYVLKQGKILLEKSISNDITVSLGAIKPGYSFGWSAIFGEPYTVTADCVEPSEVLAIDGKKLYETLNSDHEMGFVVMQSLIAVIKNRLDRMQDQFLKAIREHPDIEPLIEPTS